MHAKHEVKASRERYAANEVRTKQEPEWPKIVPRYYDWVSLLIVRALTPIMITLLNLACGAKLHWRFSLKIEEKYEACRKVLKSSAA